MQISRASSDAFVVIAGAIRSLLLAASYRDGWVYVASVATGFKHDEARALKKTLDKLKTRLPPVKVSGKTVVLTSPTLIAEIEYRAWTDDDKLRHASYKGLRERQNNADVYRLQE